MKILNISVRFILAISLVWLSLFKPVLADEAPAFSLDDLDCANLDVRLIDVGADLITPAQVEFKKEFSASFAKDKTLAPRMAAAAKKDPWGLCHYRDANKAQIAKGRVKVVFLGDSITEGWLKAQPNPFNHQVINRGIAGQGSGQLLLRFREDVLKLRPQVVHLLVGVNDINSNMGIAMTLSNIQSMVELAQANKIKVILGSLTPTSSIWLLPKLQPQPYVLQLNTQLKAMARNHKIIWVDYYSPMANAEGGLPAELSNDGLHPNNNGYAVMNKLAERAITKALRKH